MVEFRKIGILDYKFLYEMLKNRPAYANISHREMPEYDTHCTFIDSHPYKRWFIIFLDNKRVGNCYITDKNEIGIFLLPEYHGKGIAKEAVEKLMLLFPNEERFLANISLSNDPSKRFFKKMGFKQIQETYELRREK